MTKKEQIAYTAGWVSNSYSIVPPKYHDAKLQVAYERGKKDREDMYK